MSISDERDLAERLDQAIQAITPRPAPVGRAVRQGTVIRVRRRLAAAAALMVVTAGVAVPLLLHQQASQPALNQARHHHVTVHLAGPQSPAGLIAAGTVDGRPWRLTMGKPGRDGATPGTPCFTVLGTQNCGPVVGATRADPVSFSGNSAGPTAVEYGPVSAAVRYVTVRLADGTVLTLRPVRIYGSRYVAYGVPVSEAVSRVTAYSAQGELASAIPFNGSPGGPDVGLWLRPGQTGLSRATHPVGSGTVDGHAWSLTAYLGPWGECLVTRTGGTSSSACDQVSSPQHTTVLGSASGPGQVTFGTAAADVEHLVIILSGGGTIRVRAIAAGEQKFFAFSLAPGQHAVRWLAYDAARRGVGSGRFHGH
ncbi:MAG TPA: hypothetical protein VIF35_04940 [Streptosporangiaceae bacterium]